jgi:hypothetical protein
MKAFVFLQAAEKAFPLRSQSCEPLKVPEMYASGLSLLAALLRSGAPWAAGEKVGLIEQLVSGGMS